MTMCEYDRNLLKEIMGILREINGVLKETKAVNIECLRYVVEKGNKQARIHQDAMRYHLGLMEDANEEEG